MNWHKTEHRIVPRRSALPLFVKVWLLQEEQPGLEGGWYTYDFYFSKRRAEYVLAKYLLLQAVKQES